MKKRARLLNGIILMLSMVFVLCVGTKVEAEGVADSKLFTPESCFTIDSTTGLITTYTDADASNPLTEIVIPTSVNGVVVKGLSGTFKDNINVKTVIIPDSLTVLGDDTFNGCTAFAKLSVYLSQTSITVESLSSADTSVDWKNYVKLNDTTVYEIVDKNAVVIPTALATLGERVFNTCAFKSFYVMDNNQYFIDDDKGMQNEPEGIGACLMSKDMKYLYRVAPNYQMNDRNFLLPAVEEICDYAVEGVYHNGGFEIPNTVVTVGDYAFYKAHNTNFIKFQETSKVTTMGSFAFAYIQNLGTEAPFVLPVSVTTLGEYCFGYCQNLSNFDMSKSSVVSIPAFLFKGSTNLHEVTLPATVKTIEAYAFFECDNFNNIYFLGDTLEKIGTAAFQGCQNLHEIDVPEGVTAIENDTFSGCQNLNVIKLPDSLTTIGDNAFEDCQNIHEMEIPPNVTYMSNTTFNGVDPEKLENVDTSKNAYAQTKVKKALPKKNSKWTVGKLKYKITKAHATKGTVMVVGAKDKKQKTLTIPSTVNINGYAFKVTSIGSKAFYNNKKLKKVTIGSNVTAIGKKAFQNCKKLKTITVKSQKVKSVKSNAFKNIHKKAKIKLPKMSKKKFNKYKKKFMKKGQATTVKITK